ncbi:F-box protein GID2-like [Canna indica]|uniref:F-box protein GID2-like n=1 Tax=Canna indica TaxID=4628 RepID=A0AAQ3QIR4_9LILI|nr:F-box protein GID2-like [Canna indica]
MTPLHCALQVPQTLTAPSSSVPLRYPSLAARGYVHDLMGRTCTQLNQGHSALRAEAAVCFHRERTTRLTVLHGDGVDVIKAKRACFPLASSRFALRPAMESFHRKAVLRRKREEDKDVVVHSWLCLPAHSTSNPAFEFAFRIETGCSMTGIRKPKKQDHNDGEPEAIGEESTAAAAMKRFSIDGSSGASGGPAAVLREEKNKRPRSTAEEPDREVVVAELGEDLVLEVLKRADARTVGRAACACRLWRRIAEDERLWEAVCTRDWIKVPCGKQQLRSVVLALGGFRQLHSLYILPFLGPSDPRPTAASPSLMLRSTAAALPSPMTRRPQTRLGKDEVQLSLALLSIGFFEKMKPNNNRSSSGDGSGSGR